MRGGAQPSRRPIWSSWISVFSNGLVEPAERSVTSTTTLAITSLMVQFIQKKIKICDSQDQWLTPSICGSAVISSTPGSTSCLSGL